MKKKKFILLFVSAYLILISVHFLTRDSNIKGIVLENVEALASGEGSGGDTMCVGSGSIDCFSYKVAVKITGF
jgi:hypothetical protein